MRSAMARDYFKILELKWSPSCQKKNSSVLKR